jgi:hypothetical protein
MAGMKTVRGGLTGRCRGVIWGAVALVSALAVTLGLASVALAAPKGIFARFAQCPTSKSGVTLCQRLEITGGAFSVGKTSIPIERPIILQGGAVPAGGRNFNEYFLVPGVSGESISPNEETVPGGLQTLLGCPPTGCRSPNGGVMPNAVIATIEPAASPTNRAIFDLAAATEESGPALTLPVRVQLHNALLGNACYLGSEAQPIKLRLTDGTTRPPLPNKPISGALGQAASEVEYGYEANSTVGLTLVDNAFSVPVAKGCGGSQTFLIDPEIDRTLGLESFGGRNTAILKGALHMAEVDAVLASEAFPSK